MKKKNNKKKKLEILDLRVDALRHYGLYINAMKCLWNLDPASYCDIKKDTEGWNP